MITLIPYNATHIRVRCDDWGVEQELVEHFTFDVPGAKFSPKYRSGIWDGKIKLFSTRNKLIYRGLIELLYKFAKSRGYPIEIDTALNPSIKVTREEVSEFMHGLQLVGRGVPIEIRDYQITAVHKALSNKRLILESATSSGKSLIIYSIIRYALMHDKQLVLIVPTVNLVNQMVDDFKDYSTVNGWDTDEHVHKLYAGKERVFNKPVIVSTWQTLASMKKSDPSNYQAVTANTDILIADEAHTLKATVVCAAIEGFVNTDHRIGTTGTMDNAQCNALVLIGLMGPVHKIISASQLIEAGQAVPIQIRVMLLQHPPEFCKMLSGMDYKEEIKQIVANKSRNEFIVNLTLATKGNTLLLYRFVENHGKVLYNLLKEKAGDTRPVYFIHGGVAVEERDHIRKILDTDKDAIIVATEQLMATGINVPSIENLILAMGGKSAIRIRQSIGRTLRLKEGKTGALIFDIADDYRATPKGKKNHSLRHMEERLGIYIKENFEYVIKRIPLKY